MPKKKSDKNSIEEGLENFAEEMGAIGERVERYFEGNHKDNKPHSMFGLFGPFLSSLCGIIFLAIIIWFMGFINSWLSSDFLLNLHFFLLRNIGFFFLISLFFSYNSYFSKCCPQKYTIISPVVYAVGISVGFWIAGSILNIINLSIGIPILNTVSFRMINSIFWLLGIVIIVGYAIVLVKFIQDMPYETRRGTVVKKSAKPERKEVEIKRLYRSGKDKILGGVCGGIGEYLGVDPVLIRLLWIASFFAFGTGILLYIIAWIIIPRNPKHKWVD